MKPILKSASVIVLLAVVVLRDATGQGATEDRSKDEEAPDPGWRALGRRLKSA
jgi:hypothetical protein